MALRGRTVREGEPDQGICGSTACPAALRSLNHFEQAVERKLACASTRSCARYAVAFMSMRVQVAWLTKTSRVRDDDAIALATSAELMICPFRQDAVRLLRPRGTSDSSTLVCFDLACRVLPSNDEQSG